jgi:hypothetical protein
VQHELIFEEPQPQSMHLALMLVLRGWPPRATAWLVVVDPTHQSQARLPNPDDPPAAQLKSMPMTGLISNAYRQSPTAQSTRKSHIRSITHR